MESTTTTRMQKSKVKKSLSLLLTRSKPVTGIDRDNDSSNPPPVPKRSAVIGDPVLSYLAVADKNGAVLPAMLPSMFRAVEDRGEKCRSRRRKWRTLRAALIETALMRMVIKTKKANKEKSSLSKSSSNLEVTSGKISSPKCKSTCEASSNDSSTFGNSPALITSSSPRSRIVSSSSTHETLNGSTGETKQKQCGVNKDRKKGHDSSNIALCCMLSISLLVLILWGKLLAILFTSTWLYLVPLGPRKPCNVRVFCGESELDSVQNKKGGYYGRGSWQ